MPICHPWVVLKIVGEAKGSDFYGKEGGWNEVLLLIESCKQTTYPWTFFVGMVPVMGAFVGTTLITQYDEWDPVLDGIRLLATFLFRPFCLIVKTCRRTVPTPPRLRELDREQNQSLIS